MTTAVAHAPRREVTGFEYNIMSLSDLRPVTEYNEKQKKHVLRGFDSEKCGPVQTSTRFMTSFMSRFGISGNIFNYYTHEEVFGRISEKAKDDTLRVCVEKGMQAPGFEGRLMGVSTPTKGVMHYDNCKGVLATYGGQDVKYADGVVTSTHLPRSGDAEVKINGDAFSNRYELHTPIDGYGRPNIYLSLLRHVCTNGAVGYTRAFRSELAGGDDIAATLIRALDAFDNSEGYDALRQRFEVAGKSEGSVRESLQLYKTIAGLHHTGDIKGQGTLKRFHAMTGDINRMYGLANLDSLSEKRQRTLPVACSVYQLLNFASELGSHHTTPAGRMKLNAYVGSLVSEEYDLEGSIEGEVDGNNTPLYLTGDDAEGSMADGDIDLNLLANA